jgi:hypothetical protein
MGRDQRDERPEPYCDVAIVSENGPHVMELPERLLPVAEAKGWRRVVFKYSGVSFAPLTACIVPQQSNPIRQADPADERPPDYGEA